MAERQYTLVCAFDMHSPRISAYDIHEWIYVTMCLQESEVAMVQIDGTGRQVYIKFRDPNRMYDILQTTNGRGEFRHAKGEISKVRIEEAGLGIRRVRLANIPPEIPDRTIKVGLNRYDEVKEVKEENWSRANGIWVATIRLSQHIPSHILIAGYRTLISYEGQPLTCFGCNETGHVYQECPRRRRTRVDTTTNNTTSWAKVGAMGSRTTVECEDMEEGMVTEDSATAEATHCVLKDSETQRMEQDPTTVENTQKAEEHKVVESTRETKQKWEHENLSEEPDVEGTIYQALKITMNNEESHVRQKSKGANDGHGRHTEKE